MNEPRNSEKNLDRRTFLTGAALAAIGSSALASSPSNLVSRGGSVGWAGRRGGPVVISSGNGKSAVERAMEELANGADPVDAAVEGVTLVENDPNDTSVGYGGLPNEEGIVQLDSSVMHGPSHKAGAVGCIERIKNPAKVALEVLRKTDHVMIVGEGARRFALAHGFAEENLLTERARKIWLKWKANLNPGDDWLDDDQNVDRDWREVRAERLGIPWSYGTIHCSALNADGDLAGVTTTSGLSFKIPGRVGDSPIVGAGMFVDNEVGAAGATGRGEAVIQSCGSFQIVQHMANGDEPTEACLKALRWIARHTKRRSLLNGHSEPNFNVTFYALRKDGAFGSACMRRGGTFAIDDGSGARVERSTVLFEDR